MTTTLPGATSLEHLLGTVGEAMTPQVVSVRVDTPADIACAAWSGPRCPAPRWSTAGAWPAW